MNTKSSDEIIKDFVQLPCSYIKYILSLLRGKQNISDKNMKHSKILKENTHPMNEPSLRDWKTQ